MNEISESLNKGIEFLGKENFTSAEGEFKKIIDIDKNNLAANFYLGHLLQLKKDLKEAKEGFDLVIKEAEKILEINGDDVDALFYQGASYGAKALQELNPINMHKFQRIFFQRMDRVLELNPHHFQAMWLKARGLALNGRFDEAIELVRSSLEIQKEALVYVDLGLIYTTLRRFDEAENSFKEAIKLNPNSPTVYYNLHLLYQAQKRFSDAENVKKRFEELMKG